MNTKTTPDLTRRDVILALAAVPDDETQFRNKSAVAGRLNGANLEGLDLSRLNFSFMDLSDCDCRGAAFRRCRFHGARIFDANFAGADLSGAEFDSENPEIEAVLNNVDFTGAKLCRVMAGHITAEGTSFVDADLTDAKFNGADLVDALFDGAKLDGADFSGATLREGSFRKAILSHNVNLAGVEWWGEPQTKERRIEPETNTSVTVGGERETRLQAATARGESTDPVEEPDLAYFELHEEYDEIADRVEANGGPKELVDAVEFAQEESEKNPTAAAGIAAVFLRDVVRIFWSLPESERMQIMNGWRWRPAGARVPRKVIEHGVTNTPFLSVLTLKAGSHKAALPGKLEASFAELPTESTHAVRMHVRVGTTQEETLAAIDAFRQAVANDWGTLITEGKLSKEGGLP